MACHLRLDLGVVDDLAQLAVEPRHDLAGVLAGANMAAQESMSKFVTPASSKVGSSGNKLAALHPGHRQCAQGIRLTCGMPVVRSVNIIDTRPPSTSLSAGGTLW